MKKMIVTVAMGVLLVMSCQDADDCNVDLDWEWEYTVSGDWIIIQGTIDNTSGNTIVNLSISWEIIYSDNTKSTYTFKSPGTMNLPPGKSYAFDENTPVGDKSVTSVKVKKKDILCS